jgi:hypothetical protein
MNPHTQHPGMTPAERRAFVDYACAYRKAPPKPMSPWNLAAVAVALVAMVAMAVIVWSVAP